MKFLNSNKVLCLSPHPDDVEYSMAGTIVAYPGTEFKVVVMSQGTRADFTTSEHRVEEVAKFWDYLKLENVSIETSHTISLHDKSQDQWLVDLDRMMKESSFYPNTIIGPSSLDSHFEHKIVNQIMLAIGRKHSIDLIEYKSPSTLREWVPNLFIGLSDTTYDLKIAAFMNSFASQVKKGAYFNEDVFKLFHQDFTEAKKEYPLMEQFKIRNLYR